MTAGSSIASQRIFSPSRATARWCGSRATTPTTRRIVTAVSAPTPISRIALNTDVSTPDPVPAFQRKNGRRSGARHLDSELLGGRRSRAHRDDIAIHRDQFLADAYYLRELIGALEGTKFFAEFDDGHRHARADTFEMLAEARGVGGIDIHRPRRGGEAGITQQCGRTLTFDELHPSLLPCLLIWKSRGDNCLFISSLSAADQPPSKRLASSVRA